MLTMPDHGPVERWAVARFRATGAKSLTFC